MPLQQASSPGPAAIAPHQQRMGRRCRLPMSRTLLPRAGCSGAAAKPRPTQMSCLVSPNSTETAGAWNKIGDRATSDLEVRLQIPESRRVSRSRRRLKEAARKCTRQKEGKFEQEDEVRGECRRPRLERAQGRRTDGRGRRWIEVVGAAD